MLKNRNEQFKGNWILLNSNITENHSALCQCQSWQRAWERSSWPQGRKTHFNISETSLVLRWMGALGMVTCKAVPVSDEVGWHPAWEQRTGINPLCAAPKTSNRNMNRKRAWLEWALSRICEILIIWAPWFIARLLTKLILLTTVQPLSCRLWAYYPLTFMSVLTIWYSSLVYF